MAVSKKQKYFIAAGAIILIVGAAITMGSGGVFQGKLLFKFDPCLFNPNGTSQVASLVPSEVISWVSTGSSTGSATPGPSNSTTPVVSTVTSKVVSDVPCPRQVEKANVNEKAKQPFVHPSEPVTKKDKIIKKENTAPLQK